MARFWLCAMAMTSKVVLASTTSCSDVVTTTGLQTHSTSQVLQGHIATSSTKTNGTTPLNPSRTPATSLLPHLPWASNGSQTARPTGTSVPSIGTTLTVTVGAEGELKFAPLTLEVPVGSIVMFDFLGLNHTLTESALQDPCRSNNGFDTGFAQFNPANASGRFVVEYKVTDRNPKWFFCAQTAKRSHCQAGMVFSLNPGGHQKQFLENALAAVTPVPTETVPACRPLVSTTTIAHGNLSIVSSPSGAATSRLGTGSAGVSPLISNGGGSVGVQGLGVALAWVVAML